MCVYSMVMDHYKERFPVEWWPSPTETSPWQVPGGTVTGTTITLGQPVTDEMRKLLDEMRKLILEFRTALQAAKVVDDLTKQPDCEDPEKARLVERVAELERRLDAVAPRSSDQGSVRRIKGRTRVNRTP